jgi:hypothetical protein
MEINRNGGIAGIHLGDARLAGSEQASQLCLGEPPARGICRRERARVASSDSAASRGRSIASESVI